MNFKVIIQNPRTNDTLFEQLFECLDVGQVVIWLNTHKSLASPVVEPEGVRPGVVAANPLDESVPF